MKTGIQYSQKVDAVVYEGKFEPGEFRELRDFLDLVLALADQVGYSNRQQAKMRDAIKKSLSA